MKHAMIVCWVIVLSGLAVQSHAGSGKSYGEVTITSIVDVYDGDTFRVNIKGWPAIIGDTISVRIAGIDTPEKRGGDEYSRSLAMKAAKFTEKKLRSARVVTLKNIRRDKYFRILADVYIDRWNLARELVRVGLAREYYGGKKARW
jgi:endonuclease YncB( thermonuclease family)